MQFTAAIALLFASVAVAYTPCNGLYGNPQCCGVSVLGVANLDCAVPNMVPNSAGGFMSICANQDGKSASCCAIPVLGQGVLCKTPVGVKR